MLRAFLALALVGFALAEFDFGGCEVSAGEGGFPVDLEKNKKVPRLLGTIPEGKADVRIDLVSDVDLDIIVYDERDGVQLIGWCSRPCDFFGILNAGYPSTGQYEGMSLAWSGYDGVDGNPGQEWIEIQGVLDRDLKVGVLAYEKGTGDVTFSWQSTQRCKGSFTVSVDKDETTVLGSVGSGIGNLYVQLIADDDGKTDIDVSLYDTNENREKWPETGVAIVGYCEGEGCNEGIINGPSAECATYRGVDYCYSGYFGVWDEAGKKRLKGNEWISIKGQTNREISMAAFGYRKGSAIVDYWWDGPDRDIIAKCPCTGNKGFYKGMGVNLETGEETGLYDWGETYGNTCSPHDLSETSSAKWTTEPWCYMSCDQNDCPEVPRFQTVFLSAATVAGVDLCYSYKNCGGENWFDGGLGSACVEAGGVFEDQASVCVTDFSEPAPATFMECTCTGNDGFYKGTDGFGDEYDLGVGYGNSCSFHDEDVDGDMPWLKERWCYVSCDPSACPGVERTRTTELWAATEVLVPMCISYQACGSTDHFAEEHKKCKEQGGELNKWTNDCIVA